MSNRTNTVYTFLTDGFRNKFEIGYRGDHHVKRSAPNLKLDKGTRSLLWQILMKEVKPKRYAGHLEKPPFNEYVQSPIGISAKKQWRQEIDITPVLP